jgi:hypothetical protein
MCFCLKVLECRLSPKRIGDRRVHTPTAAGSSTPFAEIEGREIAEMLSLVDAD